MTPDQEARRAAYEAKQAAMYKIRRLISKMKASESFRIYKNPRDLGGDKYVSFQNNNGWENHSNISKKVHELKSEICEFYIDLDNIRFSDSLRRQAAKLDSRRKQPPLQDHPLQLTADDAAEIDRLETRLNELRLRRFEREVAEWRDVRASADALLHYADLHDAKKKEEREQEEQERADRERLDREQHETNERLARERFGLRPLDVLGLPEAATDAAIKKRYRELMKRLHPDTNAGDAAATVSFAR